VEDVNMRLTDIVKFLSLSVLPLVLFFAVSCSQFGLYNMLESEQEGEFFLGVKSVNLKINSDFVFTSVGGYLPYTWAVIDGVDGGVINSATGAYTAPGTAGERTVECRDGISQRDSASVFVYEPVTADHASFSIRISDPDKELVISGGSGLLAAAAGLGAVSPASFSSGDSIWYTPPATTGTDYIEITDELDNSLSIRVEVLADTGDTALELLPVYAVINPGATREFTIANTTGNDLSIALTDSFGTIDIVAVSGVETGAVVEYTAPGTDGAVFLTVTDDSTGDSVQAEIYVQEDETPLEIAPGALQVAPGSTVEFTASGVIPPYLFSRVNGTGTLIQTSPTTANYTPTSVISMIRVTDRVDNQAKVKIQVK
jgi:hypothetical protein